MLVMDTPALLLLKKTLEEEANSFLNLENTPLNWTTVYIKEELLSPDENQNYCFVDPLKRVKPEFEVLLNEFGDDLNMPASAIVPDFPATG